MTVSKLLIANVLLFVVSNAWKIHPSHMDLVYVRSANIGSETTLRFMDDEGAAACGRWYIDEPCGSDCGITLEPIADRSHPECPSDSTRAMLVKATAPGPFTRRIRAVALVKSQGQSWAAGVTTIRVLDLVGIQLHSTAFRLSTGVPAVVDVLAKTADGDLHRASFAGIDFVWTLQQPSFCSDSECKDCAWRSMFPESDSHASAVANVMPFSEDRASNAIGVQRFLEAVKVGDGVVDGEAQDLTAASCVGSALFLEPKISGRIILCTALTKAPEYRACKRFHVMERLFTAPKGPLVLAPASTIRLKLFKRDADGTAIHLPMPSHQFLWLVDNIRVASIGIHHGIIDAQQEGSTKIIVFDMHLRDKPAALIANHDMGCSDTVEGMPRCTEDEVGGLVIELEVAAPRGIALWTAPYPRLICNGGEAATGDAATNITEGEACDAVYTYSTSIAPTVPHTVALRGVEAFNGTNTYMSYHRNQITPDPALESLFFVAGKEYTINTFALSEMHRRIVAADNMQFVVSLSLPKSLPNGMEITLSALPNNDTQCVIAAGTLACNVTVHSGVSVQIAHKPSPWPVRLQPAPPHRLLPVAAQSPHFHTTSASTGSASSSTAGGAGKQAFPIPARLSAELLPIVHPRTRLAWEPHEPLVATTAVDIIAPLQCAWPAYTTDGSAIRLPVLPNHVIRAPFLFTGGSGRVSATVQGDAKCASWNSKAAVMEIRCAGTYTLLAWDESAKEDSIAIAVATEPVHHLQFASEAYHMVVGDHIAIPFFAATHDGERFDGCSYLGDVVSATAQVPDESRRNVQDAPASSRVVIEVQNNSRVLSELSHVPLNACGMLYVAAKAPGSASLFVQVGDIVGFTKVSVFSPMDVLFPVPLSMDNAESSPSLEVPILAGRSVALLTAGGAQAFDTHCKQEQCDRRIFRGVSIQLCIKNTALADDADCTATLLAGALPDLEDVSLNERQANAANASVQLTDIAALLHGTTRENRILVPGIMGEVSCSENTTEVTSYNVSVISGFSTASHRFFTQEHIILRCIPVEKRERVSTLVREEQVQIYPLTSVTHVPFGENAIYLLHCKASDATKDYHLYACDLEDEDLHVLQGKPLISSVSHTPSSMTRLLEEFAPDYSLLRSLRVQIVKSDSSILLSKLLHMGYRPFVLQQQSPKREKIEVYYGKPGAAAPTTTFEFVSAPSLSVFPDGTCGGVHSSVRVCCSGAEKLSIQLIPNVGELSPAADDAHNQQQPNQQCIDVTALPTFEELQESNITVACIDEDAGAPGEYHTLQLFHPHHLSLSFGVAHFVEGQRYPVFLNLHDVAGNVLAWNVSHRQVEAVVELSDDHPNTDPQAPVAIVWQEGVDGASDSVNLMAIRPGSATVFFRYTLCSARDHLRCKTWTSNQEVIMVNRRLRVFPSQLTMLPGSSLMLHLEQVATPAALHSDRLWEAMRIASSNESVATVDSFGAVYASSHEGTATISIVEEVADKLIVNDIPVTVACTQGFTIVVRSRDEELHHKNQDVVTWVMAGEEFAMSLVSDAGHSPLSLLTHANIRWKMMPSAANTKGDNAASMLQGMPYSTNVLAFGETTAGTLMEHHYDGFVVHAHASLQQMTVARTQICANVKLSGGHCMQNQFETCVDVVVVPKPHVFLSLTPKHEAIRLFPSAAFMSDVSTLPISDALAMSCQAAVESSDRDVKVNTFGSSPTWLTLQDCTRNNSTHAPRLHITCSVVNQDRTLGVRGNLPSFSSSYHIECAPIHHFSLISIAAPSEVVEPVYPLHIRAGGFADFRIVPYDIQGNPFSVPLASMCTRLLHDNPSNVCNGDTLGIELYSSNPKVALPQYAGETNSDIVQVRVRGLSHGRAAILAHFRHEGTITMWDGIIQVRVHSKAYPAEHISLAEGSVAVISIDERRSLDVCKNSAPVTSATSSGLYFESSDNDVATITSNGCLVAHTAGECQITVRGGAGVRKIHITVYPISSLSVRLSEIALLGGIAHDMGSVSSPTSLHIPAITAATSTSFLGKFSKQKGFAPFGLAMSVTTPNDTTLSLHDQIQHPFEFSCALDGGARDFVVVLQQDLRTRGEQTSAACFIDFLPVHRFIAAKTHHIPQTPLALQPMRQSAVNLSISAGTSLLPNTHIDVTAQALPQIVALPLAPMWINDDSSKQSWRDYVRVLNVRTISAELPSAVADGLTEEHKRLLLDSDGQIVLHLQHATFVALVVGVDPIVKPLTMHYKANGAATSMYMTHDPVLRSMLLPVTEQALNLDYLSITERTMILQAAAMLQARGDRVGAVLLVSPALLPVRCLTAFKTSTSTKLSATTIAECVAAEFEHAGVRIHFETGDSATLQFAYHHTMDTCRHATTVSGDPAEVLLARAMAVAVQVLPALLIGGLGAVLLVWKLTSKRR